MNRTALDRLSSNLCGLTRAVAELRVALRRLREFQEFADTRFQVAGDEPPALAAMSMRCVADEALTTVQEVTQAYRHAGAHGATLEQLRQVSTALADVREVREAALTATALLQDNGGTDAG